MRACTSEPTSPHVDIASVCARACVCMCVAIPFILDVRFVGVPAGDTKEEGHTGFLIHLPSAVLALNFLARRIQLFLSLVDREVGFLCTNDFIVLHLLGAVPVRDSNSRPNVRGFRGYQVNHRGDRRRFTALVYYHTT